jgi:hypothetical protein
MNNESRFPQSFIFYNQACGIKDLYQDIQKIKKVININGDIPIALLGLLRELAFRKPPYYWNRKVADEVEEVLIHLIDKELEPFEIGFENSTLEFFEAIRAFENITRSIGEIRNVAFEESFKTTLFRNPIYAQICEDLLMNLYRVLKNIINEYSEKDYSNLNTLGQILPCLIKNGFTKSTEINSNLRNAVNHGNVFVDGDTINYRYGKSPKTYENASLKYWEYDNLIDHNYDIACGILVGFQRILASKPDIITNHIEKSKENALQWFRLIYKNPKVNIKYLNEAKVNEPQLNVNIHTTIEDHNHLVFALIELAKGAYMHFHEYDRYLVGFTHNRSSSGFIRLTNNDLDQIDIVPELYQKLIDSQDILIMPILDTEINENAYKYHVFPKQDSTTYEVLDIKDCSIENFKRIKAKVLLNQRFKKKDIKALIERVVSGIRELRTPQNPYEKTKFGEMEADIVFLNVFINNPDRRKFDLFPNNSTFVCSAHYYKNTSCPRLRNGGVMASLWHTYKKEKIGNRIHLAWNPNYKPKA